MYRIIPLRPLRRTTGVFFDEVTKVPVINDIDRVIHKADGVSPGPVEGVKRPWYAPLGRVPLYTRIRMTILQGERYSVRNESSWLRSSSTSCIATNLPWSFGRPGFSIVS